VTGGTPVRTVAVLGTGHMGSAMSRALAAAGFDLVLYNRTIERCEPLAAELGARVLPTAAQAVAAADVAISMVADELAVEALYRGESGVLEGLSAGKIIADSSTVPPSVVLSLADDVHARGAEILDAPVSGSTALASTGGLTIMVGGDEAALERARPVFDALAKRVFHLGALGNGAAMKLAVNTLIFGLNQAVAEGLVIAERAGIDRSLAYDVLAASAAGAPYVEYKRRAFLDPEGTPPVFSIALAEKDLNLITAFAERLEVPVPQAHVNRDVLREAMADGRAAADFADVAVHLRGGGPG
jgi:3-hydroxyisobutyrate dehydrogenase/2-hydroxy-3-oxopropionate reductase